MGDRSIVAPFASTCLLLFLLLSLVQSGAATADAPAAPKRLALVIGHSAYENFQPLSNTLNDSALIAKALGEAGFEVIRVDDAGHAAMRQAVVSFAERLRTEDADG